MSGRFVLARAEDLPGRFLRKGELIGYVTQEGRSIVRVVVSQDDVDLVRNRLARADVRLAENMAEVVPANVLREVRASRSEHPGETRLINHLTSYTSALSDLLRSLEKRG